MAMKLGFPLEQVYLRLRCGTAILPDGHRLSRLQHRGHLLRRHPADQVLQKGLSHRRLHTIRRVRAKTSGFRPLVVIDRPAGRGF